MMLHRQQQAQSEVHWSVAHLELCSQNAAMRTSSAKASPFTVSREQLRPSVRMMKRSALRGQVCSLRSQHSLVKLRLRFTVHKPGRQHLSWMLMDASAHVIGRKSAASNGVPLS